MDIEYPDSVYTRSRVYTQEQQSAIKSKYEAEHKKVNAGEYLLMWQSFRGNVMVEHIEEGGIWEKSTSKGYYNLGKLEDIIKPNIELIDRINLILSLDAESILIKSEDAGYYNISDIVTPEEIRNLITVKFAEDMPNENR